MSETIEDSLSPSGKTVEGSSVGGVSNTKTVLNLMMSVIGIGVLALPKGIAEGGWVVSVLMFFVTCALSHIAVVLLYRCLYFADAEKPLVSYQAVGEAAFGQVGKVVVAVVNYLNLFTVCACMLILLGDCMQVFWTGASSFSRISVGALAVLPLAWLPSLKEVAAVSVVGVSAVVVTCVTVVTFCAMHMSERASEGTGQVDVAAWPARNIAIGISFANFMNSYTVAPVVPAIVASMRHPSKFPLLSLVSFVLVSVVFVAIGFSGYLAYGQEVKTYSSVGEAINRQTNAADGDSSAYKTLNVLVQVGILLVCLSHFVSLFNPVALSTEQLYLSLKNGRSRTSQAAKLTKVDMWTRIALRTIVVAACYGVAAGVSNFTSLVNLLGATFVMLLQLIFPFAFHHALAKKFAADKALPNWVTYSVVSLGFVGMIFGTYASIVSFKK